MIRRMLAVLAVAAMAVGAGAVADAAGKPVAKKAVAKKASPKKIAVTSTTGAAVVSTAAEVVVPRVPPGPATLSSPARGTQSDGFAVKIFPESVVNGGAALAVVYGLQEGDSVTGTFNGQAIPFAPGDGIATALVGVDIDVGLSSALPLRVRVKRPGGQALTGDASLSVFDAKYEIETFTVPKEKDSSDDPKLTKRILADQKALAVLWPVWTGERLWKGSFVKPVPGIVLSKFGGRRVINGQPRRPHAGIDQRGATGTPIVSIANARVAYAGDQFFSGNVTVLDHGHGVYSMYCHQSKIVVKKGQLVAQGEKIGEVGMTGRVTGPHLHWGLRVNGARVDPERVLELDLGATGATGVRGGAPSSPKGARVLGSALAIAPMTSGTAGTP